MLGENKLRLLYELGLIVNTLPGSIAEAGVWCGGALYLLASVARDKTIHGFDSWEGLPPVMPEDGHFEGMENTGWGKCLPPTELLAVFGERVKLHKGWFCDTLSEVAGEQFCLVHVDCDRYSSAKECLEFFYPRMVDGGYLIFDDYGFHLTPGVTVAVDEFFGKAGTQQVEVLGLANLILLVRRE